MMTEKFASLAMATALGALALVFASPDDADSRTPSDYYLGKWTCTYENGANRQTYSSAFSRAVGDIWLREIDTDNSGAIDDGYFTYDQGKREWTEVVVDKGRGVTILRAKDAGSHPLRYR